MPKLTDEQKLKIKEGRIKAKQKKENEKKNIEKLKELVKAKFPNEPIENNMRYNDFFKKWVFSKKLEKVIMKMKEEQEKNKLVMQKRKHAVYFNKNVWTINKKGLDVDKPEGSVKYKISELLQELYDNLKKENNDLEKKYYVSMTMDVGDRYLGTMNSG